MKQTESKSKSDFDPKMIERLISDIRIQPQWRADSALCELYYDGRQAKQEMERVLEERGQPLLIYNLIHPTVNGVLGMEAKTRTDWIVKSDDAEGMEVSEVLNEKLNEVARISQAARACSDAFARQVKAGIGWVEVRRNDDPFGDKYVVEEVDYAEVWYDWNAKRADLKDARWIVREKWLDLDQAQSLFPHAEELLEHVFTNWDGVSGAELKEDLPDYLVGAWNVQSESKIYDSEWKQADRRRLRFFEVWYRKPVSAPIMRLGDAVVKYDPNNEMHVQLRSSGRVQVQMAVFSEMRRAIYCGPHLLHEGATPYPHNEFPLVPFFGYREGRSRVPYGLIRNMVSAQDGVNFRHSMLTWLLKARRITMLDGATKMTDHELQEQVARVDGIIKIDPSILHGRSINQVFSIDSEQGISGQQFNMMEHSQRMIQDTAGVYNALLGKSDSGATSGIAINSLVEQGSITLSELYDNYALGRQQVGFLLVAMEADDLGKGQREVLVHGNETQPTKRVKLNYPDEKTGRITNQVSMLKKHVVMADIHTTAGYKQQLIDRLMQVMQSLPENVQPILLIKILELSDLPDKGELINSMRQAMGMQGSVEDMTPEQKAQYESQQQLQAQQQKIEEIIQQQQLKQLELDTEIKEGEAALQKVNAILEKTRAEKLKAETELTLAKSRDTTAATHVKNKQVDESLYQQREQLDQQVDRMISQLIGANPAS